MADDSYVCIFALIFTISPRLFAVTVTRDLNKAIMNVHAKPDIDAASNAAAHFVADATTLNCGTAQQIPEWSRDYAISASSFSPDGGRSL